jgi:hypothetical protein
MTGPYEHAPECPFVLTGRYSSTRVLTRSTIDFRLFLSGTHILQFTIFTARIHSPSCWSLDVELVLRLLASIFLAFPSIFRLSLNRRVPQAVGRTRRRAWNLVRELLDTIGWQIEVKQWVK